MPVVLPTVCQYIASPFEKKKKNLMKFDEKVRKKQFFI